jgi:ADP-ribose pyrophosphatase
MAYELIERQYRHRGRVLDLSLSRFSSATRGDVVIELIHHHGGAGALPLFDDGTVALVRQWRYPLGRFSLEIAAGRIEPGQTPAETAARELEEELGYRARRFEKLSSFAVAPGYCEEVIHTYLAMGLEKCEQSLDDDEEIDIVHLSLDEAIGMVRSGEIDDAKSIITLMMTERRLREPGRE